MDQETIDALILLLRAAQHHRNEARKFRNSALASSRPILARAYLARSEWHLEVAREFEAIDRLIEHGDEDAAKEPLALTEETRFLAHYCEQECDLSVGSTNDS